MCQLQNKKIDGELNKRHTAVIFGKMAKQGSEGVIIVVVIVIVAESRNGRAGSWIFHNPPSRTSSQ